MFTYKDRLESLEQRVIWNLKTFKTEPVGKVLGCKFGQSWPWD
jgi:hypothetical protein